MRAPFGTRTSAPALKQVARLASAIVIGIAVALVTALVLVGTASSWATQRVSDAATDAVVASVLESRVRNVERLGSLRRLSGNDAYGVQQRDELASLLHTLETQRLESDSPYEQQLLAGARESLEAHLARQERLAQSGASAAQILQETHPSFVAVLSFFNKLRGVHRERIEGARRNAETLRMATIGAGFGGLVLLCLTLAGCLMVLRRWVFEPLSEVARALDRLGRGDRKAKISESLPVELSELAGSVNFLAGSLEGKHDNEVRYLGMLAHDLRNPLAGLRLAVERMLDSNIAEAERVRAHRLIVRQIDRFDRMVQELLDAARVESGHMGVRPQPADVRALAADVVELHRSTCSNPLRLCVPPAPVMASIDPMRIEQVLGNLILNAIDHSPHGEPIDVILDAEDHEISLIVTDLGTGIPPEIVGKIFAPFFECAADGKREGTGLGLSIVRQIVEAHEGRVEVDTKVGRGSTFRVHLPRELLETHPDAHPSI